ncbi:MAG: DoxX family protein [Chlamydiota bacterium]
MNMIFLRSLIAAIGRICLSVIFILSGASKLLNWHEMELTVTNAMNDLNILMQGNEVIYQLTAMALPWSKELLGAAMVFEIIGGLLVFLGIRVRLGALLLILFLIPTTFLFHHYWLLQGADRELQMTMFLKNLSILGGLFVVLALGTGGNKGKNCAKLP